MTDQPPSGHPAGETPPVPSAFPDPLSAPAAQPSPWQAPADPSTPWQAQTGPPPPWQAPGAAASPTGQPGLPPPGQPGFPPPYGVTPVKQRNPALKIVLVVLAGLLALCCAGGAIAALFIYRAATDVGPARNATRSFVRDLESGNATDAYSRLCPSTKQAFPPAVFESLVQSQPQITGYHVVTASVNTVNGSATATVVVDLDLASGRTERHSFLLTKDSGKWLVCGDPY